MAIGVVVAGWLWVSWVLCGVIAASLMLRLGGVDAAFGYSRDMSQVLAHAVLFGGVAQGCHGEAAFHDFGFGFDQCSLAAGDLLEVGHLFTGADDALLYAYGGSGF